MTKLCVARVTMGHICIQCAFQKVVFGLGLSGSQNGVFTKFGCPGTR